MKTKNYIFGYGSLVNLTSLQKTKGDSDLDSINYHYCHLLQHVRIWNVGMDNSQQIKGYKYYVNPTDLKQPDVFVTFLNVQESPDHAVKGILFEVSEEELRLFDQRERQYSRKDITDLLDIEIDGTAWVYTGLPDSMKRFEEAFQNNRAVISQTYQELVHSAYQSLGEDDLTAFKNSTINPGLSAMELKQVKT